MFAVTDPQTRASLCCLLRLSLRDLLVTVMLSEAGTQAWRPHLRLSPCRPGTLLSCVVSSDRKPQACFGGEGLNLDHILLFSLGSPRTVSYPQSIRAPPVLASFQEGEAVVTTLDAAGALLWAPAASLPAAAGVLAHEDRAGRRAQAPELRR